MEDKSAGEISERFFDRLAAVPSNLGAIEASSAFGAGDLAHVVLTGPSGSGKTTMMEAAVKTIRTTGRWKKPALVDATAWVDRHTDYEPSGPLLLDNAQDGFGCARSRVRLTLALERRIRSGTPTMLAFTGAKNKCVLRGMLPRFHAWTLAEIKEPAPVERQLIVRHLAAEQGLVLSDPLLRIMARRLCGHGRTLDGALNRLRVIGKEWRDDAGTLRACGILNPYFEDNGLWDYPSALREGFAKLVPEDNPDLLIYLMMRVARLHEDEVARYLELEPARCYSIARSHAQKLRQDEGLAAEAQKITKGLVQRLASE